jgi:hypothetical protein
MTPQEIAQLSAQSPVLKAALKTNRETVWQFLREQVSLQYVLPCENCEGCVQLLRSPYARDLCIECLLDELLVGGPLEDEIHDPRSRRYDPVRANDIPEGVWWS